MFESLLSAHKPMASLLFAALLASGQEFRATLQGTIFDPDKAAVPGAELPWIENNALDIVQTDSTVTGLSENWFISHLAHVRGELHWPHNWHGGLTTIANAHLVASSPSRHMLELNQTYNPLKEEIFKDPLVVKKGYMDLPDRPGYGVELIPDVEKTFPWAPGSYQMPNPLMEKL
jgi:hypothetical protein